MADRVDVGEAEWLDTGAVSGADAAAGMLQIEYGAFSSTGIGLQRPEHRGKVVRGA
jgi:hypothetical protein